VWSPTDSRSASSLAPAYVSSEHTYTPWSPTDGVTRSSPRTFRTNCSAFFRGLPRWVVNASSRTTHERKPRIPASRTPRATSSSQ